MNVKINFLIAAALLLMACGKSFTPATQKDLENLSEADKKQGQCINENIVLTFSPGILSSTNISANSTKYGSLQSYIYLKTGSARLEVGPSFNGRSDPAIIKKLCSSAVSASLTTFNIEQGNRDSKNSDTTIYSSLTDTVFEVWACHGTCN